VAVCAVVLSLKESPLRGGFKRETLRVAIAPGQVLKLKFEDCDFTEGDEVDDVGRR
jgi:hypothetical protein